MVRLGGMIAFVCGRMPYPTIFADLSDNGFVKSNGERYVLTDGGMRELIRLTSLAGLRSEHFAPDGGSDLSKSGPLL